MKTTRTLPLVVVACLWGLAAASFSQSGVSYDVLVQQGKAQLQAGNNDAALASANAAIKLDANLWEAYALQAGALINLGNCDEAKLSVGLAMQKAPENKKNALNALLAGCVSHPPSMPLSSASEPSLSETRDWLAQTMLDYGGSRGLQPSRITKFSIDSSCTLHWSEHAISGDASDRKWFQDTDGSVPLGSITQLQALSLEDNRLDWVIRIQTGQVNAIQWITSGYKTKAANQSSNSYDISVQRHPAPRAGEQVPQRTEEMLPRIAKAFQHAITLCRGTYTVPIRATQPF